MPCYILFWLCAAGPPVPVFDFGNLPPANTVPGYRLTVTVWLDGRAPEEMKIGIGAAAAPVQVADALCTALGDSSWVMKRDGLKVTLRSFGKARVTNVTVAGNGPLPVVRWEFAAPPKK